MIGSAGLSGAFGPDSAAHLQAVLGVGHGVLVGHLGQAQRLVCPRPGAPRSSSRTSRPGPCCGWPTSVPTAPSRIIWQVALPWMPILCSSAPQKMRVALAQRAVGVDAGTWAPRTARCPCCRPARRAGAPAPGARCCRPGRARRREMKIFWPVMLVAAVGLRLGLGAQQAQVGAAVRLGQAHGAGPLAAGQLGQVSAFCSACRARAGTRRRRATGRGTWSRPGWPSSASRRSTGSARCGRPWPP